MKSKVKRVNTNGFTKTEFNSHKNKEVTYYYFEYEFEDGKRVNARHMKNEPFEVGTELEYEIKGTNEKGSWGSVKKPFNNSNSYNNTKDKELEDRQMIILAQSSLHRSVELITNGVVKLVDSSLEGVMLTIGNITSELMDIQLDLVEEKLKPVNKPSVKPQEVPPHTEKDEVYTEEIQSDLPF